MHPSSRWRRYRGRWRSWPRRSACCVKLQGWTACPSSPPPGPMGSTPACSSSASTTSPGGMPPGPRFSSLTRPTAPTPPRPPWRDLQVVSIPSNQAGGVDLDALRQAVGPDTAGLMLTNPNTVGLFDANILEITQIVHDAGGLCYYDGANLNAVMGQVRPGDMGFDCVHLNLHKTFSTPHGGGGPGSGPVGCKAMLEPFLPTPRVKEADGVYSLFTPEQTMGQVRSFYGNFLVVVKALSYLLTLGKEGIPAASAGAVLNANYLMKQLMDHYDMSYNTRCMHEFVMTLQGLAHDTGVTAMDVAKRLLDFGIHPPTMYFPLIVHEALMVEPTETESPETLDQAAQVFLDILAEAKADPESLHQAPRCCPVGRPDEVTAARSPILRYSFGE
ncbi:MAG: aminomethyl-transferring glycine dehydrogenase subunit GcvPB [Evtepia gabavorous]